MSARRGLRAAAAEARGGGSKRLCCGRSSGPGQRRAGQGVGGEQRRERVAGRAPIFFRSRREVLGDFQGVEGAGGEVLGVGDDCFFFVFYY